MPSLIPSVNHDQNHFFHSLNSLLSFAILCNDEFYIKPEPRWIEPVQFEQDAHLISKNKANGASYLLFDIQDNVEQEELFQHHAIKINEESGIQNYSDLWINYDPSYQKVLFHKLVIHRGDKELNRLKREDFKITRNETDLGRNIYNGNFTAGIYLEDIQVGDVVEYAYTIKGNNPVFDGNYFGEFNLEFGVPMNRIFLQVNYPENRDIYYKLFKNKQKPEKSVKNGQVFLTWNFTDIPEIVTNSELPGWYIPYAKVQLSEFRSWKEVIDWGEDLYPEVDIKTTPLEEKFKELTHGLKSEDDKINALIRFVQDEIRYVGIEVSVNSHKPHSPHEVYSKRFGDCKDKSYLLVTLLRHMGVKASPAYVNSIGKQMINDHLPSPLVFNHAIVAIDKGNELYFVDPTFTNQKGNYKQAYNGNYQSALVVEGNQTGPVNVKMFSEEKIIIHETIVAGDTLQPTGYEVESTFMGSEADQMRASFNTRTRKELESSYLDFYDYIYPNMRIIGEFEIEDDEENNIVKTTENYEIDDFWTYDNSSTVDDYTSIISPVNLRYYISEPEQMNREMPYAIYHPIEVENRIEFINFKEATVEEVEGEINNPSFRFSYKVSTSGKKVIFDYKYKSLKDHVTVADFDGYYKDVDEIINSTWYQFTFGKEFGSNGGSATNWLMVIISVFLVVILIYLAGKFYRRDEEVRITTEESQKIGGWIWLPAIGLLITPFLSIYNLYNANYFNQSFWEFISSSSSEGYDAVWSATFLMELLLQITLLVYTVFLIVILFQRRTIFPIHYVSYRILFLLFIIADTILIGMIESDYFIAPGSNIKELIQASVAAVIWVPYMLGSRRVKNTFVKKFGSREKKQILN